MQIRENGASVARTAAMFGAACMALAFAGSLAIPDRYVSDAVIDAGGADPESVALTQQRTFTRKRLQALIGKHHLYASDVARLPAEDVIEMMQRNIHVTGVKVAKSGKRWFRLGFQYSDPAVAQRVTADLTSAIVEEQARANPPGGAYSVADSASKPDDGPVFPNRTVIALMGLAGGSLTGGAWALLRRRRRVHSRSGPGRLFFGK